MVAPVKHVRLGPHSGLLVEHADEILDGLLGALGVDPLLVLFQLVGRGLVVLVKHAGIEVQAGMRGDEQLRFGGTFLGRGLPRSTELGPQWFGDLGELLFEGRRDVFSSLLIDLCLESPGLGLDDLGPITVGITIERD